MVQLSHLYITTRKTIALTRWIFVGKMMSLLFNTLSRIVTAFLPRSKRLLVSWLQSPSTVTLEPRTIKSVTASTFPISPFPTSLLSYGAACCMFPGEGNGTPTPVLLLGESQGRGSLVGCRLWGRTESDTTEVTQQQQHSPSWRGCHHFKFTPTQIPCDYYGKEDWDERAEIQRVKLRGRVGDPGSSLPPSLPFSLRKHPVILKCSAQTSQPPRTIH